MNSIEQCTKLVKDVYKNFDGSHDFSHIERVLANAREIVKTEPDADPLIVDLAVLLHDVSDAKYVQTKHDQQAILTQLNLPDTMVQNVQQTIDAVSYRGGHELPATTIEMKIVRDADRLDAIGAIGIARAFMFGGAFGSALYDDEEHVQYYDSEKAYRQKNTSVVGHFYEKLLQLKNLMTTTRGKQIAEERHQYMVSFLDQLSAEREGKL